MQNTHTQTHTHTYTHVPNTPKKPQREEPKLPPPKAEKVLYNFKPSLFSPLKTSLVSESLCIKKPVLTENAFDKQSDSVTAIRSDYLATLLLPSTLPPSLPPPSCLDGSSFVIRFCFN